MFAKIRPRRGTKAQWETANTVLAEGEIGFEVPDDGVGTGITNLKIGDGTTAWNDLPYAINTASVNESLNGFKNIKINTGGSTATMADDIFAIWGDIEGGNGGVTVNNGTTMLQGNYIKSMDGTVGSMLLQEIGDNKLHIWSLYNGKYSLDEFVPKSDLAIEEVSITAIDSSVVKATSATPARKMGATKMFSFGIYFTLSEAVIKEGTPYVKGFARPLGSQGGIYPIFNCIYRNTASGATRLGTCYIGYEGNLVCGYRDHVGEITGYDQVFVNGAYPYA